MVAFKTNLDSVLLMISGSLKDAGAAVMQTYDQTPAANWPIISFLKLLFKKTQFQVIVTEQTGVLMSVTEVTTRITYMSSSVFIIKGFTGSCVVLS